MRTAQPKYGTTSWGRWFLDKLNKSKLSAQLESGRAYISQNRVTSFKINDNKVEAKVKGHYKPFYIVEITFPLFTEADKNKLISIIESEAVMLPEIALGKLPEPFLSVLESHKFDILPPDLDVIPRKCSCPDMDLCKHIASVYLALSREIDADPTILFAMRGFNIKRSARDHINKGDTNLDAPFEMTYIREEDLTDNNDFTFADEVSDSADTTHCPSTSQAPKGRYHIEAIPNCVDLITSLLPAHPPFLKERDFTAILRQFYEESLHEYAWEPSDDVRPNDEHTASRSEWSIQCDSNTCGDDVMLIQETVQGKTRKYDLYNAFIKFRAYSDNGGTDTYRF
jgi:uncharacterized Zn finger protein